MAPVYPFKRLPGRRLVICNWRDSAHPQAGGAELYCERVAGQLSRMGIEVTLVTSRPPGRPRRQVTEYGEVIRLGGTFTTYPLALWWLWRNRRHVDVVLDSENGIPFFTPLVAGRSRPVVLLVHHVHQAQFSAYLSKPLALVGRWLERKGASWVYGRRPVCVVSPSARAEVRSQLQFRGPLVVAPGGFDPPEEEPAPLAGRAAAPRLAYVGRLVPHKRVELLLRALPALLGELPELSLDVVGDGPSRQGLEELSGALGLAHAVRFHGRTDDATRDELLSVAWLAVNPTAGEGWGMSVIEAAGRGVPTVAVRVPGMVDSILHGATGWLADEDGQLGPTIAAALRLLAEPGEAARWAERCRNWAWSFSWEHTAERVWSIASSEEERLTRRYENRRDGNDTSTIVSLDPAVVPLERLRFARRTDQVRLLEERVEVLVNGADEMDAERVAKRMGIAEAVVDYRLARPADLFGWRALHPGLGQAARPRPGGGRRRPAANGHAPSDDRLRLGSAQGSLGALRSQNPSR